MMKDIAQVRRAAVNYLSRREYCPREMVDKLVSKGADLEMAETVVQRLSDIGLICEERFAREFIRARVRQGYGPIRIEFELTRRGVAEHLASECLLDSNTNWNDQLERVIERKYRNRPIGNFNEWAKRANFLKNRGFTAEQINDTLGRYQGHHQLD